MNNASAVVKWMGCGAALILAGAPQARAEEAAVLDSVVITADQERADGPVQGYRAKRSRSATKTDTPIEEIPQSISVVPASVLQDLDSPRVEKALGFAGGGDVAVSPQDPRGLTAVEPFFRILARVPAQADTPVGLAHGRLGTMRLTLDERPLLLQWERDLRQFLQRRFRV